MARQNECYDIGMVLLWCLSFLSGLLSGTQQPVMPAADCPTTIYCDECCTGDLLTSLAEDPVLVSKVEEVSGGTLYGDLSSISVSYTVPFSIQVVDIIDQHLYASPEELEIRYRKLRL